MDRQYTLWFKSKKKNKQEKWSIAEYGSYEDVTNRLSYFLSLGVNACYWKIAEEDDKSWMEWY